MIVLEKLSLMNIDSFRQIYDKSEDSYVCEKSFFEIYDHESFIVKFIIRKQIKLLRYDEKLIGYIWHEYPISNKFTRIYAFSIDEKYIDMLETDTFKIMNKTQLIYDIIQNYKHDKLMEKLNFNLKSQIILMNLNLSNFKIKTISNLGNLSFKHFKCGKDELLRCDTQNAIFEEDKRVLLTVEDIKEEEKEDYFLEDYSVFLNLDDETIGYGQVILYKGKYTVVNFGIKEEYRGYGYGEKLITYLLNFCKINKLSEIYIRVEKSNIGAVALYRKVGFRDHTQYGTYTNNIKNIDKKNKYYKI